MISEEFIKQLAVKWQTSDINIIREYVQHHFLSFFYKQKEAEEFFFKGGTALRIVYQSPRFSEDLDFSTLVFSSQLIEKLIEEALVQLAYLNIKMEIKEAKETSGGYFFDSKTKIFSKEVGIKLNFVFKKKACGEPKIINSLFLPPYSLIALKEEDLVGEKITALLTRKKLRDYFDLYFILRSFLDKTAIRKTLKEILALVKNTTLDFTQLKPFLPKSFWIILKDFKESLVRELERLKG